MIILVIFSGCPSEEMTLLPEHLKDLENVTVYDQSSYNVTSDLSDLEFIKEFTIGVDELTLLGHITKIAVDDDGRIYLADYSANTIHVFNPDGSILHQIGREGSGPGEFRSIYDMNIDDEKLYVLDHSEMRMSLFSLDTFEIKDIISLQFTGDRVEELSRHYPRFFYILDDGHYLMQFVPHLFLSEDESRTQEYYIVSGEGAIKSDRILELPWGRDILTDREIPTAFEIPYGRRSLLNVSDDKIYYLWTEELAVKKYDLEGNYISAFYHPVEKSIFNLQEVLSLEEFDNPQSRRLIRDGYLPDTWPAVQDLVIDDKNRFWISITDKNKDTNEWWILEQNGEIVTRFTWPEERRIQIVRDGHIYTFEKDEGTGMDQIVKYRIRQN